MFVGKFNSAALSVHVMSVVALAVCCPGADGQPPLRGASLITAPIGSEEHSVFSDDFSHTDALWSPKQQPCIEEPLFYGQHLRDRNDISQDGVLPSGLLYRSYIAAPHEPRFSSVLNYNVAKGDWRWDSTLGGRVGLFRQDQPAIAGLDAWQLDLEGAAIPRLDPQLQMDVESIDYRFGLLWTARQENLAVKFGYFHISSHVGDEYLSKNPTFQRLNFVRESLILGSSLQVNPELRLYGEMAWAFAYSGGARPLQFQVGAEHGSIAASPERGAPFSAVNLQLRQEVGYAAGVTAMSGWQWKGAESGRTLRVGLQYFNGPTNQYEFFQRYDNQFGTGVWFDY